MIKGGRATYIVPPCHEYGQNVEVQLGSYCSVADNVTFCGAVQHAWMNRKDRVTTYPLSRIAPNVLELPVSRGPIVIGNDVWIGKGAFILDGVHIGDGAIVGAQSVVTKNVPPYAIFVGNPGRVVKYRLKKSEIEQLLSIRWWDWPAEIVYERVEDLKDIDVFLAKYG